MRTNLLNRSKNNFLDTERKKKLAAFQKAAGLKFKNIDILNLSFMHRSVSNEAGSKFNNERLEFLGDSILGAVCVTVLYKNYPEKNEGELAKIKAVVVSEEILSRLAVDLQVDKMLLLGKGEDLSGGRTKKTILADALEALIGAIYLDSGYKAAYDFVSGFLTPKINDVTGENLHKDYKSLLQEYCQQTFRCYPEYHLVKKTGPEHERTFWIEVTINENVYGSGTGRNKKTAEREAARVAYERLTNAPV